MVLKILLVEDRKCRNVGGPTGLEGEASGRGWFALGAAVAESSRSLNDVERFRYVGVASSPVLFASLCGVRPSGRSPNDVFLAVPDSTSAVNRNRCVLGVANS